MAGKRSSLLDQSVEVGGDPTYNGELRLRHPAVLRKLSEG